MNLTYVIVKYAQQYGDWCEVHGEITVHPPLSRVYEQCESSQAHLYRDADRKKHVQYAKT